MMRSQAQGLQLTRNDAFQVQQQAAGLQQKLPLLGAPGGKFAVGHRGHHGGVALLCWWLNLHRHPEHGDAAQKPMDRAFIGLLFLCGSTGLALLALRETAALPLSLAIHLATVMAFFLTMPYGKFAHGIYRVAALLKFAIEKRLPNRLRLGSE